LARNLDYEPCFFPFLLIDISRWWGIARKRREFSSGPTSFRSPFRCSLYFFHFSPGVAVSFNRRTNEHLISRGAHFPCFFPAVYVFEFSASSCIRVFIIFISKRSWGSLQSFFPFRCARLIHLAFYRALFFFLFLPSFCECDFALRSGGSHCCIELGVEVGGRINIQEAVEWCDKCFPVRRVWC